MKAVKLFASGWVILSIFFWLIFTAFNATEEVDQKYKYRHIVSMVAAMLLALILSVLVTAVTFWLRWAFLL